MKTLRILILEDELPALTLILGELGELEDKFFDSPEPRDFAVTVLSTYEDVERIINSRDTLDFDLILLDRDCKLGGSFHVLDIERFGADKIISISAIPQYNEDAKQRGVRWSVHKDEGFHHFKHRLQPVMVEALDGHDYDQQLRQALQLAIDAGHVSAGLLQRRLSISDELAMDLLQDMLGRGWVTGSGPGPRSVTVSSIDEAYRS